MTLNQIIQRLVSYTEGGCVACIDQTYPYPENQVVDTLNVLTVTSTSITIGFAANTTALKFYTIINSVQQPDIANTSTSYTFTGLLPSTLYRIIIVTVFSEDSPPLSCPSVSILVTTNHS